MEFVPRTLQELALDFPSELDHLSASSLKTFMRCPETFRRRYMLGERERPAAAQLWGGADHDAIEWNLKRKLETSDDAPVREVQEMFAYRLDSRVEKDGGLAEIAFKDGSRPLRGIRQKEKALAEIKDRGVRLVGAYREQVCPTLEPVAIEEPFELDLSPQVPVKVVGRVDLVAHDVDALTRERRAAKPVMRDRKTTAQTKTKPDQEWIFQGRIYQLHKRIPFTIDLSVKNKTPKIVARDPAFIVKPWAATKTRLMIEQLAGQIGYLYVKLGPDTPWPGAWTHPWACGYCGFKPSCPWWRK